MQRLTERRLSTDETDKYMRGLCPAGCITNHGGPRAAHRLADEWRDWPEATRPSWPDFLEMHGRGRLADEYPNVPAAEG